MGFACRQNPRTDETAKQLIVELIVSRVTSCTLATYKSVPTVCFHLSATDASVRVHKRCAETEANSDTHGSIVQL